MGGWDRETWALWLVPYLNEEAQMACMALNHEQGRGNEGVKLATIDHDSLSTGNKILRREVNWVVSGRCGHRHSLRS